MARNRSFFLLAAITSCLTIGLIVFGAVVRVTDSGLGCGNHWPLCNGTIFPPLDNVTAWIEWLHRLFAVLIGAFGLAALLVAILAYRRHNRRVLIATAAAALLFFVQSMLGALVVVLDLPPTFVTLHLGTAMLLLGALIAATFLATYQPVAALRHAPDRFSSLVHLTTALSLVIILTGALVRGSGATLACTTWPLCDGAVLPVDQGQWAMIHMFHRLAVAAFGITMLFLIWQAFRMRSQPAVRRLATAAGMVYLLQAGVGAGFVFSSAAPVWGALHVLFASVTWALLVLLSLLEYANSHSPTEQETARWHQPSSPLPS